MRVCLTLCPYMCIKITSHINKKWYQFGSDTIQMYADQHVKGTIVRKKCRSHGVFEGSDSWFREGYRVLSQRTEQTNEIIENPRHLTTTNKHSALFCFLKMCTWNPNNFSHAQVGSSFFKNHYFLFCSHAKIHHFLLFNVSPSFSSLVASFFLSFILYKFFFSFFFLYHPNNGKGNIPVAIFSLLCFSLPCHDFKWGSLFWTEDVQPSKVAKETAFWLPPAKIKLV